MDLTTVNDFQKALDAKPDAVIVSNPTAMHLDIAIPAAKAGVHLLLEKPISHSMERVDELAALEKLRNLPKYWLDFNSDSIRH